MNALVRFAKIRLRMSRFWAETWPVFCKLARNLARFWHGGVARPLARYVCRTGEADASRTQSETKEQGTDQLGRWDSVRAGPRTKLLDDEPHAPHLSYSGRFPGWFSGWPVFNSWPEALAGGVVGSRPPTVCRRLKDHDEVCFR
jgi:hypothetical protein